MLLFTFDSTWPYCEMWYRRCTYLSCFALDSQPLVHSQSSAEESKLSHSSLAIYNYRQHPQAHIARLEFPPGSPLSPYCSTYRRSHFLVRCPCWSCVTSWNCYYSHLLVVYMNLALAISFELTLHSWQLEASGVTKTYL